MCRHVLSLFSVIIFSLSLYLSLLKEKSKILFQFLREESIQSFFDLFVLHLLKEKLSVICCVIVIRYKKTYLRIYVFLYWRKSDDNFFLRRYCKMVFLLFCTELIWWSLGNPREKTFAACAPFFLRFFIEEKLCVTHERSLSDFHA